MRDLLKIILDTNKFIKKDYNMNAKEINKFIDESRIYNNLSEEDKMIMEEIKFLIQSCKTVEYRPASP